MAIGAGGLVFVGFNADGNDGFSLLATEDIAAGEVIYFTDKEYSNGTSSFNTGEGTLTWTTGDAISAGTVITFDDLAVTQTVTASGVADTGTLVESGSFSIAAADEAIYAYQGTDAATPTQFLSMIQNETDGGAGEIPTGMTASNGLVSIDLDEDVMIYTGTTSFPDASTALTAIGNSANWSTQDGSGDQSSDLTSPDFPDDVPTSFALCFAKGTLIATPRGTAAVETLASGDPILTQDGTQVTVKWVGRQTVATRFAPAERLMPVRFAAGSLGAGLPHADLTVTADHAMLIDGVLCNASALVNGTTITRVPLDEMGDTFTVYHIETEAHEIILANGAPTETFIDNVSRRVFDNFAEYEALYGDTPEMTELPYPRAMSARQVPQQVRSVLNADCAA
ncbi:Hint domain-containing protein [Falsiphaeobacter marinintestinus]|uniref:Hint domain-containing protein n=1 Tax=Falsiphaeobacter marinintestinus TaxID=1492905 RepID=UPI0011B4ED19|nr:Hint domain-containing protein [Phaeobacter marinintestinus]